MASQTDPKDTTLKKQAETVEQALQDQTKAGPDDSIVKTQTVLEQHLVECSKKSAEVTEQISGLRTEMVEQRSDLTGQINSLRAEMVEQGSDLTGQISGLRTEMVEQRGDLRTELAERVGSVKVELAALSKTVAIHGKLLWIVLGGVVAAIGLLVKLLLTVAVLVA